MLMIKLGMYSSEGEFVEFISPIDTELANGNVDQWLVWVEDQMIQSVRKTISEVFKLFHHLKLDKNVSCKQVFRRVSKIE